MKVVNIQNAKTHLSRLLEDVVAGEEVVIAKAGKPMARLTAYEETRKPRTLGLLRGTVTEAPDCWEADPEIEAWFYGADDQSSQDRVAEDRK